MQTIGFEAFQGVSGRLVGLGLLHSLWIGLFVASVVALALQVRPRLSHQARYRILLAAFLVVATGPFGATFLHRSLASHPTRNAPPSTNNTIVSGSAKSGGLLAATGRRPIRSVIETNGHWTGLVSIMNLAISEPVKAVHRYQPILVATWLIGVAALGGVLALGSTAVGRICREGRPAPEAIQRRTLRLARRARLRTPPRVIVHRHLNEPCLCGIFGPVILVPECWLACDDARLLDAIIAHELAHARRLDHIVNLVQRLLEVAMFFSPAVHWLSQSLRRHREFCTDALAVRLTRDPLSLAQALESVARTRLSSPGRPVLGSALGGQTVLLLPRIQELLGMEPSCRQPRLWPFAALPVAELVALLTAATGVSQEKPSVRTAIIQPEQTQNRDDQGTQTKTTSQAASGLKQPVITRAKLQTERKISYGLRFFDLSTETRRVLLNDRLKLHEHEASVSAWIVDTLELDDLVRQLHQEKARETYEDPGVTAVEDATIGIRTSEKGYALSPNKQTVIIGSVLHIAGSIMPGGARLTVDVGALPLGKIVAADPGVRPTDTTIGAEALKIIINEPFRRILCEIPYGSSLVVSLALFQRESKADEQSSANKSAVQFYIKAKPAANERLFFITPRPFPSKEMESPSPAIKGFFDSNPRKR
jgi:beta-lactamase regulating signal transducer with metallopeptidase domain